MDVILRDDVEHLGEMGDVVRVKPGHARNLLIPRGLAVVADRKNLVALEHEKRLVEDRRLGKRKAALSEADKIEGVVLEARVRAGEEDRLFGSVTNLDIEKLFASQGIEVDRRRIDLQDPIKKLGTYRLTLGIAQDVKATFTLKVIAA
jgi:large subunit ribosomal protein L9